MIRPDIFETLVRRRVEKILARASPSSSPAPQVVAIRTASPWRGPAVLEAAGRRCRVVECLSALALSEALDSLGEAETLIVITSLGSRDLGADLRLRLASGKPHDIDTWSLLREAFGARAVDPRLTALPWFPEALLAVAPLAGFAPVASGFLDADTAWAALLEGALDLEAGRTDLPTLLRFAARPEAAARWSALSEETKGGIARRWAETAGDAGAAVAHLVGQGRGHDAVPLGLALRALPLAQVPFETAVSLRVRLHALLGGLELGPTAATTWAEEAERGLAGPDKASAAAVRARAEELLRELGLGEWAGQSRYLDAGLAARSAGFAAALAGGLAAAPLAAPSSAGDVEETGRQLLEHESLRDARRERVEMALRLWRWLGARDASASAPGSFTAAVAAYAREGSFVDRARAWLAPGEADPPLAAAYRSLLERAGTVREEENRRFGEQLAGWNQAPGAAPGLLPIETVLAEVAVPLARAGALLILVFDGLSLAVFRELAEDLLEEGWIELRPEAAREPRVGVAAFPTVTEVSRTSLLCGRLTQGGQSEERAGFSQNAALAAPGRPGRPPLLFHKGDLVHDGIGEVVAEIERPETRVVGVVINAVDDQLPRGGQLSGAFRSEAIRPLKMLLAAAARTTRTVLITADHGHILETGLERRGAADGGARHRFGGEPAGEGEVELQGGRVVASGGGRLVVPWSERLRYGQRQGGYHGGVSPQEALVPVAVLARVGQSIAGWTGELAAERPLWWDAPVKERQATPLLAEPRRPRSRPTAETAPQATLPFTPAPPARAGGDWIARLLASPVLADRHAGGGPSAPGPERLASTLAALARRGGRLSKAALAAELNLPLFRLDGFLVAVKRLLNREAYPVLSVDAESGTVSLNRELLLRQFELGEER